MQQNILREFALSYYKMHKDEYSSLKKRIDAKDLTLGNDAWPGFVNLVEKRNIFWPIAKQRIETERYIIHLLKAYVARLVWGDNGFYQIMSLKDPAIISSIFNLGEAQKLLIASKKKTNS